jgi:N-6 DNA Methylase
LRRIKPYYSVPEDRWLGVDNRTNWDKEECRQWLLNELHESYGYPRSWFPKRFQFFELRGFYGFDFLTSGGSPFLKALVAEESQVQAARDTLVQVLEANTAGGLGVIGTRDLESCVFLRVRHDQRKCETLPDLEAFADPSRRIVQSFLVRSDQRTAPTLEPLTAKLEDVLFEAHSAARDVDGLHPDEALDELCKFIFLKTRDEVTTAKQAPYRLQRALYGSTEELAVSVRELYAKETANVAQGVFAAPIRLSSPALAQICGILETYTLSGSPVDIKGRAFQKVLGPATRSGMGQFFTPLEIIEMVVAIVSPKPGEFVLDPFCGSGHFLTATLKSFRQDEQQPAAANLFGIEKSDRMVRVAMTDMVMNGDGHTNIICADSLLDFSNYTSLAPESFDVVMTNPPFGSVLGPDAMGHLGRFTLSGSRRNVPLEILGLERSVQFLKPGGRLAIVLPDGVLANSSYGDVRAWARQCLKVRAVISLPISTFIPFGAAVKTSVLLGRKWKPGEVGREDYPVFLARVDDIGYDATGRQTEASECGEIVVAAREFIAEEGW